MTGFDDDYGEDAPEQDLAAQLAAARAERRVVEEKLSALQRRHSEAQPSSADGQAAAEAAAEPAETPDTVGEAGPPDQDALVAALAEERAATAEIEAQYAALAGEPVGVTPKDRRAAELVQIQGDGALPATDSLDGLLIRLRDRSIPYPQLQAEMRAFGLRDAPPATS